MGKVFILKLIVLIFIVTSCNNSGEKFFPKDGDLLFQDLDCGQLCDAIEKVTDGYRHYDISHVGIVNIENDSIFVIEANGKGVVKTPLDEFLNRSLDNDGNPKVIVGRLNDSLSSLIPKALRYAKQYLGKPYDDKFVMNDSAFYCSELIYRIFYLANDNKPVFHLHPMTFCFPGTNKIMPVWIDYFRKMKMSVPEGRKGCNPAEFSGSKNLKIVYEYGSCAKK